MTGPAEILAAYSLETPEDAIRFYRDWARRYDTDFASAQDYRLPEVVALAYAGRGGEGPVLDIGAGTGAVGAHLARIGIGPVEGLDISPEMLAVAAERQVYDSLICADLTRGLDVESAYYTGVVSAGTFTLGHLGPEALDELIRVTSHGGLICFSVYAPHYEVAGFADKLDVLAPRIRDLRVDEARVFGDRADPEIRLDMARIVSFHRA